MTPNEKPAYPPSYNELYPNMVTPTTEMGWQPQPPPTQNPVIIDIDSQHENLSITPRQPTVAAILPDQSRIGMFPMHLQPCPHCQRVGKTTIKQESTLRTHLLALILCVMCCCCCAPLAYVTDNMTKTVNHFCENCKCYIGSHQRKLC